LKFLIKLKHLLLELIDLGLVDGIFRIGYELGWRSGLLRFLERQKGKKHLKTQINLSFSNWKKSNQAFFVDGLNPQIKVFLQNLPQSKQQKIIEIANKSIEGNIYSFSNWFANYGSPINWHLNPIKKVLWPEDVHWSKALKFQKGGDVKLVWEVNRFPQIYYLVRAWYLTADNKYVSGCLTQIKNWSEQNPYLYGVNWSSGQEMAIRLFAWIFALYNFYSQPEFSEEDFQLIVKQIYLHVHHIDHNIHYAYYAVHNNHLIGEALALYLVGILFPQFPESDKWKNKGRRILTEKTPDQFYEDGGYCQSSHNYHRLALHYYLLGLKIAELNNDEFSSSLKDMILKSAYFLYQNMNLKNGQLPNWGNNDGALLNPWTACDYSDFRPVVQSAYVICGHPAPFAKGPWDEETLWLTGENISKRKKTEQRSASFAKTGLYVLRQSEKDFCVFRCGTPPDRFGQADQLHVDLHWDGNNILTDGGSYLYNDELHFHQYFMGTASHNSIVIDDQDQMLLWRRFKWLYKTKATVSDNDLQNNCISGYHTGYNRIEKGITHYRYIKLDSDYLLVRDQIKNMKKNDHKINLNWHVNSEKISETTNQDWYGVQCKLKDKTYYFYFKINIKNKIVESRFILKNGYDHAGTISGWNSRYYGRKQEIQLLQVELMNNVETHIVSLFSKRQLTLEERQICVSS
jgi:heparinase II/III-like protein